MPRKSAASLAVVRVDASVSRLRPPAELGEEEQQIWQVIVGTCDSKHFMRSDAPLLARYCEAVVLARRAAAALTSEGPVIAGRTNPWLTVQEKAVRAMVSLSMRLRISPQARRETPAVKSPPGSVYDLLED
jgi:P27 family predicted phage terminase small subunit